MLLAASPRKDNPDTHGAFATLSPEVLAQGPLIPTATIFHTPVDQVKAPAHAIHTPQQLAQLEAIAHAQTRDSPESSTVSDEEKYLAAQLVYLASQHHASEYNRQKINPGPQSIYIPLSIQLPSHIHDLRVRQVQSTERQAWFIAERKDRPDLAPQTSVSSDSKQGQPDKTQPSPLFLQNQPADEALQTPTVLSTYHDVKHPSYVQPHSVQVSLLEDALENSVLPSPTDPSSNVTDSAGLSSTVLPVLSTSILSRLHPTSTKVDVVDTPPPLPEMALPQIPPPARSRAPSQAGLNLPAISFSAAPYVWTATPDGLRRPSSASTTPSPLIPRDQPSFWPRPPTLPAPIHVAPAPSLQLQLALETAISKDTILDPHLMRLPSVQEQASAGMVGSAGHAPLYNTPFYSNMPSVFVPPRMALPKTSETHPINISQVIPPECMSLISSHLEKYPRTSFTTELDKPQGTFFRTAPHFRLDHVIYTLAARAYESRTTMNHYSPVPVRVRFMEGNPKLGPGPPGPGLRPFASEPTFDRPLKRPFPMTPPAVPQLKIPQPKRTGGPNQERAVNLDLTGNGHESPEELHTNQARASNEPLADIETNGFKAVAESAAHNNILAPITLPSLPTSTLSLMTPQQPSPSPLSPFPKLRGPPPATLVHEPPDQYCMLGNLYMSSCPGKKVRLNGPVKGRGAICRDLGVDLARVKAIGVDLVICCLDDDELEFLGAPWPEYEDAADVVGLDVLRLPMPEGLCPLSVKAMSQHMDRIIRDYTLAGRHVLVHCRGGVGRAGLVACTWMLKLGICGSVEPNDRVVAWDEDARPPAEQLMRERRVACDTLELLERVVYVIRRQRSVKAIETYEQVRFLLEFIEHLRYTDAKALLPV